MAQAALEKKEAAWNEFARDYPDAAKAWLMGTTLDVHPAFLKYVYEWDCDRNEREWLRCSELKCSVCGVVSDDTKAYEHRLTGKQYCSTQVTE